MTSCIKTEIIDTLSKKGSFGAAIALAENRFQSTRLNKDLKILLELYLSKPGFMRNGIKGLILERSKHIHETRGASLALRKLLDEYLAMNEMLSLLRLCQNKTKRIEGNFNCFSNARRKVIVFLHNSLPHSNAGYATRAHGILKGLANKGFDIHAYTRPGFPEDSLAGGFTLDAGPVKKCDRIDNISYSRISSNTRRSSWEYIYMLHSYQEYFRLLKDEQPDTVIGRSTYLVSFPAMLAAKALSIPFFYEVSGLWEMVYCSKENPDLSKISRIKELETLTAKNSAHVFTMTDAMRREICNRGVPLEKITLAPNCASPNTCVNLIRTNSNATVYTFGYIGSFQFYEGLEDLVDAFDNLLNNNPSINARLLLIGDGPWYDQVRQKVLLSQHSQKIIMTGRVSKDKVINYYSTIDLCVYPRKPLPVTEMVSPVKPLEAMLLKVPILMSDVDALKEISGDGRYSQLFSKGDIVDLEKKMLYSHANPRYVEKISKSAYDWVLNSRTWDIVAKTMSEVIRSST